MKLDAIILLALPVLLAGCGSRQQLRPAEGATLPPPALGETDRPTPAELMTPSAQARPGRTDEVLTRSQERQPDRFDLPPP